MNRRELANLLSQTQSMMAPSRTRSSALTSEHPLSPRQTFQSHVRTLSENPPSPTRNQSRASPSTPQLRHVSSLRVRRSESPSPTRSICPSSTCKLGETALEAFSAEPQFITEEREVWGRPSPPGDTNPYTTPAYRLGEWDEQSTIQQTRTQHHKSRPFAPFHHAVDINDRPKTSRGPQIGRADFATEPASLQQEEDDHPRPSKFAEGSMNDRSAGVSSTWSGHGSLASVLGTNDSDNDTTPRASPERSSIDINEFNPQPVSAPSFAQRLLKFGTKSKSKDVSKHELAKVESEPQPVRKKGLRKSLSTWTLHADKKKAASQMALDSSSPQKKSAVSAQPNNMNVLNDRKRRAEEVYAQTFGTKRRKSNMGIVTTPHDQSSWQPSATASDVTPVKTNSTNGRRRLSWSSSTNFTVDPETFDGNSERDLKKRPSRRELEKENQQLRALLRQQQDGARSRSRAHQPTSPPSRSLLRPPGNGKNTASSSPRKSSANKLSQENLELEQSSSPPPVPALPTPDRTALKPLTNTRHVAQQISIHEDLQTISEDVPSRGRPINQQPRRAMAEHSRRASSVRGVGLPRQVSMILERDEESEVEKKPTKENRHPLKDIPKLNPTPLGSQKRLAMGSDGGKTKAAEDAVVQLEGAERQSWEWPDDVF